MESKQLTTSNGKLKIGTCSNEIVQEKKIHSTL